MAERVFSLEHALLVLTHPESDGEHAAEGAKFLRALDERHRQAVEDRSRLLSRIFRDSGQMEDRLGTLAAVKVADTAVTMAHSKLDEYEAVRGKALSALFFCMQLLMDHEPGCGSKELDATEKDCDCDVMIPSGDPKRAELWDVVQQLQKLAVPKVAL